MSLRRLDMLSGRVTTDPAGENLDENSWSRQLFSRRQSTESSGSADTMTIKSIVSAKYSLAEVRFRFGPTKIGPQFEGGTEQELLKLNRKYRKHLDDTIAGLTRSIIFAAVITCAIWTLVFDVTEPLYRLERVTGHMLMLVIPSLYVIFFRSIVDRFTWRPWVAATFLSITLGMQIVDVVSDNYDDPWPASIMAVALIICYQIQAFEFGPTCLLGNVPVVSIIVLYFAYASNDDALASSILLILVDFAGMASAANLHLQGKRTFLANAQRDHSRRITETLLKKTLPNHVIETMKTQGSRFAASTVDCGIVMFADISGFTRYCRNHSAEDVVEHLNRIVSSFDLLCRQHGMQKIKTIGDGYMAVAFDDGKHEKSFGEITTQAVRCGLQMCETLRRIDQSLILRVGIHAGTMVVGVIGLDKIQFDAWGDTVNIGARLEQSGKDGYVHISEDVRVHLLEGTFSLSEPAQTYLKGVGHTQTYFVLGDETGPLDLDAHYTDSSEYSIPDEDSPRKPWGVDRCSMM